MSDSLPSPERILVRQVNWLGDAIMTLPALSRLKDLWPHSQLAVLVPEKLDGFWCYHPAVDCVLTFGASESSRSIAGRVRTFAPDIALLFPNSFRSAFEVWLARVGRRTGYAGQWRRALLTDIVAPSPDLVRMRKRRPKEVRRLARTGGSITIRWPVRAHHVYHYLHHVRHLGADGTPLPPRLIVPPDDSADSAMRFGIRRLSHHPIVGLNPGAEYGLAKRWPPERFVQLALDIDRQVKVQWLIFGGSSDVQLAEQIATQIAQGLAAAASDQRSARVFNLAGQTNLKELCHLLSLCQVVVTNDTGPMHLAAALQTQVVALFGSTAPELTRPGSPLECSHPVLRHPVPCAPCFLRECPIDLRCLKGIEVATVTETVLGLLTKNG